MQVKQDQLGKAIALAVVAHFGQQDRGGNPYILHPLHLMNQFLDDPELATIAVLHDVIEDSSWTIKSLSQKGYSSRVMDALSLLTHYPEDSYSDYINKLSANADAVKVKLADIRHNSDITRLKGATERDYKRLEKYHKAFLQLHEIDSKK